MNYSSAFSPDPEKLTADTLTLGEVVEWLDFVTMYRYDWCFINVTVQSVSCCFPLILAFGSCLSLASLQASAHVFSQVCAI